jgi:uncharacterized membrane protein
MRPRINTWSSQAAASLAQRRFELWLAAIAVIGLVYRLLPINRGLGQDELYSAVNFIEVPSIWTTLFSNDAFNNHIGYSMMARFAEAVFGHSEWALRLPAAVLGIATLIVFYYFGRGLVGPAAALVATFLLAVSPPHIAWSVAARGYSALIFFTLLSSQLFFRLLAHTTRRDAIFFVAVSVFGIYVHLYAVFVTAVQVVFLFLLLANQRLRKKDGGNVARESLRTLLTSFVIIAVFALLLYVPVLRIMARDLVQRGRSDFDATFPGAVLQDLTGGNWLPVVLPVLLVSLVGWLALVRSRPKEATYFAVLFIGPLLTVWVARPFDLYTRFFAYWLPYYVLLIVAGLRALWAWAWPAGLRLAGYSARILASVLVAALLFSWTVSWRDLVTDEGYRQVSQTIAANAGPSDAFCAIGGARTVWQHYIDKPIAHPQSLADLQDLARTHTAVRCVYYEASWQGVEQTQIAQFLKQHATGSQVNGDLYWFVYTRAEE